MKLRGIKFRNIFNSPGILGLYGEGYWFQGPLKYVGLDFKECGFITRVVTLSPKSGNMEMDESGIHPKDWIPPGFKINFRKKFILNHLGIGNPGVSKALEYGYWQTRSEPFFISFVATSKTVSERVEETREFVRILDSKKHEFKSKFGIQINFFQSSKIEDLYLEVVRCLKETSKTDIPVICRFNPLIPIEFSIEVAKRKECDAISISHPIKWGSGNSSINWEELFGEKISPLKEYGGGWLSGEPVIPIYQRWIDRAILKGISKPIISGGAMTKSAVKQAFSLGASAVEIGSVAFLRPWRVKSIIAYTNHFIMER